MSPTLQCIVVTPELTVYEQPADFVAVTLYDGEIGIAPEHTPLIGRLGNGELRVRRGQTTDRFYVEGGFIEVVNNVVTLLTHRAIAAEKIDREAARQRLEAASSQPTSPAQIAARDQAISQARAQLHVAEKTGI
jgi:F-type H+-transporting ATPase subunit epsilon